MKDKISRIFDTAVYFLPVIIVLAIFSPYVAHEFKLSNSALQIYWKKDGEEYSEDKSIRLCAGLDEGEKVYRYKLKDVVANSFRVDPVVDGVAAEKIQVSEIRVLERLVGREVWIEVPIVTPPSCNDCTFEVTKNGASIYPTGEDPFFELENLKRASYSAIEIELAVDAARVSPWLWINNFYKMSYSSRLSYCIDPALDGDHL